MNEWMRYEINDNAAVVLKSRRNEKKVIGKNEDLQLPISAVVFSDQQSSHVQIR